MLAPEEVGGAGEGPPRQEEEEEEEFGLSSPGQRGVCPDGGEWWKPVCPGGRGPGPCGGGTRGEAMGWKYPE